MEGDQRQQWGNTVDRGQVELLNNSDLKWDREGKDIGWGIPFVPIHLARTNRKKERYRQRRGRNAIQ